MDEKSKLRYLSKLAGSGRSPLIVVPKTALIGLCGGFIAIGILGAIDRYNILGMAYGSIRG
jgi:hypothetical protein